MSTKQKSISEDVFISYSRRNSEFVRKVVDAISAGGNKVWVDWEDIPYSVDWWEEIEKAIDNTHHILVIISPDSMTSRVCSQEIQHAILRNKRIIPVVYEQVNDDALEKVWSEHEEEWGHTARANWDALRKLNWLFFNTEEKPFDEIMQLVLNTIAFDHEHVKMHTRLLVRATDWQRSGDNPSYLIRGDELAEAEYWLKYNRNRTPKPTPLHVAFINASQEEEDFQTRILQQLRRFNQLTNRFMGVAFFVALGVGQHVYRIFRASQTFSQQRITNTIAVGVLIGLLAGIVTLLVDEVPHQKWDKWSRVLWYIGVGWLGGALIWTAYVWLFLTLPVPPVQSLLVAGAGLGIGFGIKSFWKTNGWVHALIMSVTLWVSFLLLFQGFWQGYILGETGPFGINLSFPIIAYDQYVQIFTVAMPMALLISIGIYWNELTSDFETYLYSRQKRTIGSDASNSDGGN